MIEETLSPTVTAECVSHEEELCRMMDGSRMTPVHWKIWFLSAMGIFLDGFDLFIVGIALPLIILDFSPDPYVTGLIGAAAVIGGSLTERFGRKSIYIVDLLFFIIFSVACGLSWNLASLILFRFLLGVGIGADYPICASYVCEFMPTRLRGRMLISAFTFQALGMIAAAVVGLAILMIYPHPTAWRWMLLFGAIPAVIVLLLRTTVPESPRWYLEHGHIKSAAKVICAIIPAKESDIRDCLKREAALIDKQKKEALGYHVLFSGQYLRRTILATVPWFLMDIATYAIGIFTPVILIALAFQADGGNIIAQDIASTKGAALLDIFLIIGFLLNIWLVEKFGRMNLQMLGFLGMTAGLVVLGIASSVETSLILIFGGFILFNVMMNMGPNATTFIIPAELFPTRVRASAHGFAAAFAKLGGAVGIFLMPVFHAAYGLSVTLVLIAGACFAGLIITYLFRVETMGRSLEDLHPTECVV